jgi:tight adherence protein C
MAGLLGEQRLARIEHLLDAAGRPLGMGARSFAGRRAALTVVLGAAGALLALSSANPIWLGLYLLAGWLGPDAWLSGRARRRQSHIDRDLPDFLDVLAVSVTAGVGFRPALRRVAEGVGGPVSEEILKSLQQIELGQPRREAFEALRDRNDSEFLAQFVTSLLQAEELGVPLADALQDLAREMRRSAHQRARRRAQRAGPRVSLITTALIVPGAMILILAALFAGIGTDISDTLGR